MAKPNRECIECGTKFYRSPSDPNPYCSCRCKALHQRGKECENCAERFIPDRSSTRFCCYDCNISFKRKSTLEAAPFWFQCSACLASIGLGSKKIAGMMRCMLYGTIEAQWRLRGIQAADVPGAQSWKEWRLKTLAAERSGEQMAHKLIMEEYSREMKGFVDWGILAKKDIAQRRFAKEYHEDPQRFREKTRRTYHHKKQSDPSFLPSRNERHKEYLKKNPHIRKQWQQRNPDKWRELQRKTRKKMMEKPEFRALTNMRKRLRDLVRKKPGEHHANLIGCSTKHLRMHLEAQFRDGMTWSNYGYVWHVDHIKPCASFYFTNRDQRFICFHYTNLQPLLAHENIEKGDSLTWSRAA